MLFYDEAVAQMDRSLSSSPGWESETSEGGAHYQHVESDTALRIFPSGTVVVQNHRVLTREVLRYSDALRGADSMDEFIEFAEALAAREKAVILRWVGPHGIEV
jgi:hypothetical protein